MRDNLFSRWCKQGFVLCGNKCFSILYCVVFYFQFMWTVLLVYLFILQVHYPGMQMDWIELNSIYLFVFFSLICEQFVLTSMLGEVISRNHQTYS